MKNINSNIISMVYTDLAQPGVKKVGQALSTVLDLSNTVLMPIKLLNEKVKANFNSNMKRYEQKLNDIENDKILPVPPEIGIPILEKFTYYTNEELAGLFVNLLAAASSKDTICDAHPSYIYIVEQLSVDEARILNFIAQNKRETIPFVYLKANVKGKNPVKDFIKNLNMITLLPDKIELLFPEKIQMYLENLCSKKLLESYWDCSDPSCMEEYEGLRFKTDKMKESFEEAIKSYDVIFEEPEVRLGFCRLTSLGSSFLSAVADGAIKC